MHGAQCNGTQTANVCARLSACIHCWATIGPLECMRRIRHASFGTCLASMLCDFKMSGLKTCEWGSVGAAAGVEDAGQAHGLLQQGRVPARCGRSHCGSESCKIHPAAELVALDVRE